MYVNCMYTLLLTTNFNVMFRFTKDGISVLAVVDTRRLKNNGMYPVKIEVVFQRRQKYYSTGQDVTVDEWESFQTIRKMPKKLISIENSFRLIRDEVEKLAEKGEFTYNALELRLGRSATSINSAIKLKMAELIKSGKINSYYRYQSTLRGIERFAGNNILFTDIDANWLKRCEDFWIKEGKCSTTVNIYMKTVRCVCHTAVENGNIKESNFPFRRGGYKIPPGRRRTLALTKEQIRRIIEWEGPDDVCYWRDLWVFSYLCNGINFRDMLFLKYKNIIDDEIVFIRSKTSSSGNIRVIRASLCPLMRVIMDRSGNGQTGKAESFIFKHAKGNESPMKIAKLVRTVIYLCNDALKTIAEDLDIPHFTTYAARHSFATVLKRSGTDIQFISESLGHTNLIITENYLAGFDKEERYLNSRKLTDF